MEIKNITQMIQTVEEDPSGSEPIIWIEAITDLLVALAFFFIPLKLYMYQIKFKIKYGKGIFNFFNLFVASSGLTHLISGFIILFEEALVILIVAKALSTLICLAAAFLFFQLLPDLLRYQLRNLLLEKELGDAIRHEKNLQAENDFLIKLREITQAIRMDLDVQRICQTAVTQLTMIDLSTDGAAIFLLDENVTCDEPDNAIHGRSNSLPFIGMPGCNGMGESKDETSNAIFKTNTGKKSALSSVSSKSILMAPCSSPAIINDVQFETVNMESLSNGNRSSKTHLTDDTSMECLKARPNIYVSPPNLQSNCERDDSHGHSNSKGILDQSNTSKYTCRALCSKIRSWTGPGSTISFSNNNSTNSHRTFETIKLRISPSFLESLINSRERRSLKIFCRKDFPLIFQVCEGFEDFFDQFDYVFLAFMQGNQSQGILTLFQRASQHFMSEEDMEGDFIFDVINQIEIAWDQAFQIQQEKRRIKELNQQWQRNQALSRAKQEAELSSRLKTEYLATMSHEIRTPMNAIVGFVDLLLFESEEGQDPQKKLTQEQMQTLKIIQNSSQCLLTLLNDILDYTKIDNGYLQLEKSEFHVAKTIEQVMELISAQKKSNCNLHLNSFISPDIPPICIGDRNRLRQILVNLLSNSMKFTDEGDVMVTCSTKPDLQIKVPFLSDPTCSTFKLPMKTNPAKLLYSISEEGTDQSPEVCDNAVILYFHVIDTGIGMKNDKLQLLFRKFCQLDSSITRRYGGTGLGLAICAKLVECQHGNIMVRSCFGKGSVFSFSITLQKPNYELSNRSPLLNNSKLNGFLKVPSSLSKDTLLLVYESWKTSSESMEYLFRAMELSNVKTFGYMDSKKATNAFFEYLKNDLRIEEDRNRYVDKSERVYQNCILLLSETFLANVEGALVYMILDRLKCLQIKVVITAATNLRPKKMFEILLPDSTTKMVNIEHILPKPLQWDSFVIMMEKLLASRESINLSDKQQKHQNDKHKLSLVLPTPLAAPLEKTNSQVATKSLKTTDSEEFSGLSILVVDDNNINRLVISKLLKIMKVSNIKFAVNGVEAVKMVYRQAFDIVFMDVSMPEMDGLSATRILKKDPTCNSLEPTLTQESLQSNSTTKPNFDPDPVKMDSTAALAEEKRKLATFQKELREFRCEQVRNGNIHDPSKAWIIAMTASAMLEEQRMCYEAGMDDFMAKPLTLDDVTKSLRLFNEKKKN